MLIRYMSAVSTSTVMTLGLIFIMQTLIEIQPDVIVDAEQRIPVNWRRIAEPDRPPLRQEETFDPEKLTHTELPPETRFHYPSGTVIGVKMPRQRVPAKNSFEFRQYVDGPLVSLIRVLPAYPASAVRDGLEGYVIVSFDVDVNGRPLNIHVVESTHRVFDKAAIEAAEKLKFKPRVVDGAPLPTSGIRNLFRFTMEDD